MSAPSPSSLLKLQLGPVQDFIAQARSTRDLWSGSYLLSWLMAAGIRKLRKTAGVELIYPNPDGQLILSEPRTFRELTGDAAEQILIPNLPNIFVASVPADQAKVIASQAVDAIKAEWKAIAGSVWEQREELGINVAMKDRFQAQVDRHLSIAWQVTPIDGEEDADYRKAYQTNGWHLDAVRQVRDFVAWDSASGGAEKDSLSGKEEALVGGTEYKKLMDKKAKYLPSLFAKHADYLGAVAIIKRCWHFAYLGSVHGLKVSSREFNIRSIPAIAAREAQVDDDAPAQEAVKAERYIAAIAFDGDSIGAWVNGDHLEEDTSLREHHKKFSGALGDFALKRVRAIIETAVGGEKDSTVPLGQLIYAGGDDVLALLPADAALECARKLRKLFREATVDVKGIRKEKGGSPVLDDKGEQIPCAPDASAGIAIAHIKSPLQDLIREAQKAEKRAKVEVGRPAFSVTLMKRSGEITRWGAKWDTRAPELLNELGRRLDSGALSGRFPHRVCQLLDPYLTSQTELSKQADALTPEQAVELIETDFAFVVRQQSGPDDKARENQQALAPLLSAYLRGVRDARNERDKDGRNSSISAPQELFEAVIGLCTTLAFSHRNRPKT